MDASSDIPRVGTGSIRSVDRSPRQAQECDLKKLAEIWFAGWRDAHLDILPPLVTADRTHESFLARLAEQIGAVRTIGPGGAPTGFSMLKGDELYQLYVDSAARGSGLAAVLIADAEEKLRNSGVQIAWLACAIGNLRAARFYEKHGWRRAGVVTISLPLKTGDFALAIWRYEKQL